MRELKFRTWNPVGKEMNYISRVEYLGGTGFYDQSLDNENNIWMQYTGLHDKNGKEIYEGDILKMPLMRPNCAVTWWGKPWLKYVMVSDLALIEAGGYGDLGQYCDDDIEVIGNIYETPELLKGVEPASAGASTGEGE